MSWQIAFSCWLQRILCSSFSSSPGLVCSSVGVFDRSYSCKILQFEFEFFLCPIGLNGPVVFRTILFCLLFFLVCVLVRHILHLLVWFVHLLVWASGSNCVIKNNNSIVVIRGKRMEFQNSLVGFVTAKLGNHPTTS